MSIDLSAPPVPFSFEVYPPRSEAATVALHETIRHLAAAGPALHLGHLRRRRLDGRPLARRCSRFIRRETTVSPLAHLTCVGNTYAGANALIREFLDAGITSFLALRGDPPAGAAEGDSFLGDLESAAQLVQLIDRVQAERAPVHRGRRSPAFPARPASSAARKVDIAVAAFPNGHPRSRHPREHIDALLAKQAAGATLAITQLFFHADDYLAFVAALARGGRDDPDPARASCRSPRRRACAACSSSAARSCPPSSRSPSRSSRPPKGQRARRRRPRRRARPRGRRRRRTRRPPLRLQRPRTVLAVLRDAGILTHPIQKEAAR